MYMYYVYVITLIGVVNLLAPVHLTNHNQTLEFRTLIEAFDCLVSEKKIAGKLRN